MNLEDGPWNNLLIVGIEALKAFYDCSDFIKRKHPFAARPRNLERSTILRSHYAERICIAEQVCASCFSYSRFQHGQEQATARRDERRYGRKEPITRLFNHVRCGF